MRSWPSVRNLPIGGVRGNYLAKAVPAGMKFSIPVYLPQMKHSRLAGMASRSLVSLAAFAAFFVCEGLHAQTAEPNRDPMKARLVSSDIPNFWRVFDKASLKDAADLFQREYIDPGTPGLHGFLQGRIVNGRALAATVAARPKYYAAIRESTLSVDQKPEIKEAI